MRATVTLSFSLAILLAACSGNREGDNATGNVNGQSGGSEEYYTVRAGAVTDAVASALSGNFQLQRTGAPRGIPSDGTGGACLVFAAADVGYSQMPAQCQTNADCKDAGRNVTGYCDAGAGTGPGTCWARPLGDLSGQNTCNRGVTMTQGALNPVPKQPVDAAALNVRPGAKVRVLACLNKLGFVPGLATQGGTGCRGSGVDALHDWGPPATVR